MKRYGRIMVGFIVVVFFFSGCALTPVTRTANLKMTPNGGVAYDDRSIPIIQSTPGPVAVATGAAIITRAKADGEYTRSMASLLKARAEHARAVKTNGDASANTNKIIGVVINDSLDKTLYFDNPEMAWTYNVRVGGYEFVPVGSAPKRINYWFAGDKKKRTVRVKRGGRG